jgi:hypothetical protein
MILSFTSVAVGYLISNFFWIGSLLILKSVPNFFPEVAEVWALPLPQFKQELANDPAAVFPNQLFWWVFGIGVLGSFLAGWVVVKIAPFSRFGHVIFVAVVVFVSWLQQLISGESPHQFRWMILLSMISMALATVYGGKIGWRSDVQDDSDIDNLMT